MRDSKYQRRYTAGKKAKELCTACGCNNSTAGTGHVVCAPCRAKMVIASKNRRERRIAAGLCCQCGTRPLYSDVFCLVCLEQQRNWGNPTVYKNRRTLPNRAIKALREYRAEEADNFRAFDLSVKRQLANMVLDNDEVLVPRKRRGAYKHGESKREPVYTPLDERQKVAITMYYGLDGQQPKTLEEVGQAFGVTRERIRQLIKPFKVMANQIGLPTTHQIPTRIRRAK